jgi:hypothetical protein
MTHIVESGDRQARCRRWCCIIFPQKQVEGSAEARDLQLALCVPEAMFVFYRDWNASIIIYVGGRAGARADTDIGWIVCVGIGGCLGVHSNDGILDRNIDCVRKKESEGGPVSTSYIRWHVMQVYRTISNPSNV